MNAPAIAQAADTDACVWMTAGLLTYRLCDRQYDCEHCPLDAALCGALGPRGEEEATAVEAEWFPDDRLYTLGHTWLAPSGDKGDRLRFGLDRFAASLIRRPRRIRWRATPRVLGPRGTLCEIELEEGALRLETPIAARPGRRNQRLLRDPDVLVTAPYDGGWIVELGPIGRRVLDDLLAPPAAREQTARDLDHLRRRIAHHLLADAGPGDGLPGNATASLLDLRFMLGASVYVRLLRELVH